MWANDMTGSPEAAAILARLDAMQSDMGEMKITMRQVSESMAKLAVVEERQSNATQALERAFAEITRMQGKADTMQARIEVLESEKSEHKAVKVWVDRAIWAIVAAASMYAAKKIGLIASLGPIWLFA